MTDLEQQHAQQVETIHRYQRENDRLTKERDALIQQNEHAQLYIPKLKAERERLRAQLTDEAKAEWIMGMTDEQ